MLQNELDLLGLKPSHKEVLVCISTMSKPAALISRHTGIPLTSLVYILKKLQEKSYVIVIQSRGEFRKRWRTNIPTILRSFKNIQDKKDSSSKVYDFLKNYDPKDDPDFEMNEETDTIFP